MLNYNEIQILSQLLQSIGQASFKLESALQSKNLESFEKTKQLISMLQKQIKNELEKIKNVN